MIVERQLFRRELIKTVAPALLAIALFMGAVFGVFLPAYRKNITAQSRKMIAIVTLTYYPRRVLKLSSR